MGFKEMLQADIKNVFLNIDEFAEPHTIKFDGEIFKNIPVVLTNIKQSDLSISAENHSEGLFIVSAKVYFSADDTNGEFPERGKRFEIDDGEALGKPFFRRFRVATAENAMGMICLELEAADE